MIKDIVKGLPIPGMPNIIGYTERKIVAFVMIGVCAVIYFIAMFWFAVGLKGTCTDDQIDDKSPPWCDKFSGGKTEGSGSAEEKSTWGPDAGWTMILLPELLLFGLMAFTVWGEAEGGPYAPEGSGTIKNTQSAGSSPSGGNAGTTESPAPTPAV